MKKLYMVAWYYPDEIVALDFSERDGEAYRTLITTNFDAVVRRVTRNKQPLGRYCIVEFDADTHNLLDAYLACYVTGTS